MTTFAAVDLGASSGRVIVADERLRPVEMRRFPNGPLRRGGALRWDLPRLLAEIEAGLAAAGPLTSLGIDSWAVDYGLLDAAGRLLADPVSYRDSRTDGVREQVAAELGDAELYARSGLQFLPFNTLYQLRADPLVRQAATMLLVPDLIAHHLTGESGAEVTNASTTGLLDARTRRWSAELIGRLGLDAGLFPALRHPGDTIGTTASGTPVVAVASHDTASAVVAVPAEGPRFAYLSCGTWSLAGVELAAPVLTEESRLADFTNEAGLDGTVRYLRNVMGLWILQECLREWGDPELGPLLAAAAELPTRAVVDPGLFLAPGDMPARIAAECRRTGRPEPRTPAETVRCVLASLALAHRDALRDAQRLSGQEVDVIHLVGGGARNALLCQLTADACGLPVLAGPAEATALGNLLVQLRATGKVGGLAEMRALVRETQEIVAYEPRSFFPTV
ncbi:rhamnulokinase family protein [Nonomuraea sp. NPDC050328]|uniref:rhamnulokinase family protein n=1 Tax=Nonomuraea sp. NPDC050328 TaxID=3364361 RepID=UPI0037B875FB